MYAPVLSLGTVSTGGNDAVTVGGVHTLAVTGGLNILTLAGGADTDEYE